MTLMEVVIAIGVVAFVVPLVMAVTTSVGRTRGQAEADTRSAWLARQVQQQVAAAWAQPPQPTDWLQVLDLPQAAEAPETAVLLFDGEGRFLVEGDATDLDAPVMIEGAEFVVQLSASSPEPDLAWVDLIIRHPARLSAPSRRSYRYKFLIHRRGTL
jgi:type II secretory pathway pseudopilin PulG